MPRVWFADRPTVLRGLSLATYRGGPDAGPVFGFLHQPGHTLLIDISMSEEDIFKRFSKSTAGNIRRGLKDGIQTRFRDDAAAFEEFATFYAAFAGRKGLDHERRGHLLAYRGHGMIGQALFEGKVLTQMLLLVDKDAGRVRVHRAGSLGSDIPAERRTVGRANRLLHYAAMVHFHRLGFPVFDMGGYALNTTDEALSHINRFKSGFGGTVCPEATYRSYPVAAIQWLRRASRPTRAARPLVPKAEESPS